MKKLLLMIAFAFVSVSVSAQILNPVKWSYAAKRVGKGEAMLFFKATIDDGWHIYSTNQPDGGPKKTAISFTPAETYSLLGKTQEPPPISHFEQAFGINVQYFENAVILQQRIKLNGPSASIKGKISFMVCNSQKCLPPDEVIFEIAVK